MSLCIYLSWVIYDWNFFCFSSNPTPLVALIRASTFKKYFKLMVISKKKNSVEVRILQTNLTHL